jgi:deazaflavin-dependent oxidoreductase (nitroreductase family)
VTNLRNTHEVALTFEELAKLTAEVIAREAAGAAPVTKRFNAAMIAAFRANSGQVPGEVGDGLPLLLLTSTGRKSGQPRTNPLAYVTMGDRIMVVASKGGAETNPDWYWNVLSAPSVHVEIGADSYPARAVALAGDARAAAWVEVCKQLPVFMEYQENTIREIPVVELIRDA